jgi:predicted membrane channel-forming protein YqfA (hemolysin III family)
MNFFDQKDVGKHLLKLCPKVVKHPVFWSPEKVGSDSFWHLPVALASIGHAELIFSVYCLS